LSGNKNMPGGRRLTLGGGSPIDQYKIELRITLVDGTVLDETASVPAANGTMLMQGIVAVIRSITSGGCLKYDDPSRTFTIYPTPSQIKRVEAVRPALVMATADALPS